MRKVVKPAVKCSQCNHIVEYEQYEEFCDFCKKQIAPKKHPLEITLFPTGAQDAYHAYLCSWKCVKDYLFAHKKKIMKYDFITMPFITFKNATEYSDDGKGFYQEILKEMEK